MENVSIKVLNENSVEIPISMWKFNLTYEMWSESITRWERRRIFRIFKIPYSIGNKYKDISDQRLNYNKVNQTLNEIKGFKKAKINLLMGKVINDKRYDLCEDIIHKLLYFIHLNHR